MSIVQTEPTKLCVRCQQVKPADEFHRDRRRRDGRFPYCITCRREYDGRTPRQPRMFATKAEYDRAYRQTMPRQEKSTRHREQYLWTTYRLTVDDYNRMVSEQEGRCALCGEEERSAFKGTPKHLAVDHDHACCPGKSSCGQCVRALLCHRCNLAIGGFSDNPDLLRAAISYLER